MGTFDADIQTARELIAENGELGSLTVMATADNVDEPWNPGVPTEQTVQAAMVFLNFNLHGSGEKYFEGSLIHAGDKKVLLAADGLSVQPNLNALVTRADGSKWKVVNVKLLDPNGQRILYTMQVRQ